MVRTVGAGQAHLRAREHVALVLAGSGLRRSERRARADACLERVGLAGLERRRPHQLSGGEARRLSLARVLAVEPAWILLDEAFSQLDDPTRARMLGLVRAIHERTGAGIVVATHRADDVLGLATTIGVLRQGEIVQLDAAETLYRRPVDLDAALLLGSAAEIEGVEDAGRVRRDGRVVAEGMGAGRIVRPEDVAFVANGEGACTLVGRLPGGRGVVEVPAASGAQTLAGVSCDGEPGEGAPGVLVARA